MEKYKAKDIQMLKGLEPVRKRPGMYIGGTGQDGFMHLVWEILDNSIDEASAGYCKNINIKLHTDNSIEITDDGRGIPIDKHPEHPDRTALEIVFTELHAGGKFKQGVYTASGGLHGVGAAVVNALSSKLTAEVMRNGTKHKIEFNNGIPTSHGLKKTKTKSSKSGTKIFFTIDKDHFDKDVCFNFAEISKRLKRVCCLIQGLKIVLIDLRDKESEREFVFKSENGLLDLLDAGDGKEEKITRPISLIGESVFKQTISDKGVKKEIDRLCKVEIQLFWDTSYYTNLHSFVNTIPTPNGGTHILGLEKALLFCINNNLLKTTNRVKTTSKKEDIYEGLQCAIKVTFPEPQFRGQTKQELGTPEIQDIVYQIVKKEFNEWLNKKGIRENVRKLRAKIVNAIIIRENAKKARDAKRLANKFSNQSLPAKLFDCRKHGNNSELILVEGDSAAGPAKAGRDSEYMAILPLRGKIVNAAKASQKQVLENTEAQAIIKSLGVGFGKDIDMSKARYGRIIILCDADVDGSHIRCLLITLIHKYLPDFLNEGKVFAAQPPLFTTKIKDKKYRAFSDNERDEITKKLIKKGTKEENIKWQRFKGLGEMNVDELAYCALDYDTRIVKKLTINDIKEVEDIINITMGIDVGDRQEYLRSNGALAIHNIDI